MEVNAAVEGLLEAGATEILVSDSHGPGGVNPAQIHPAARILTGRPLRVFEGLDESFDAAIMIGQHAKANTDGGHLAHSGSFGREDWQLNGKSIGEIELFLIAATYYKVPVVMISGDVTACQEARELVPSIETVAVIEGMKLGSQAGMTPEQAIQLKVAAIHTPPVTARKMIREGGRKCLQKIGHIEQYWVDPPYEMVRIARAGKDSPHAKDVRRGHDYMNLVRDVKFNYVPIKDDTA